MSSILVIFLLSYFVVHLHLFFFNCTVVAPPTQNDNNNTGASGSQTASTSGRAAPNVRNGRPKGKAQKGRAKRKLGDEGTLDPAETEICDDEDDTVLSSYSNTVNVMDIEP